MRVSDYLVNPAGGGITAGNPRAVREGYDMHYSELVKKMASEKTSVRFYDVNDAIYIHIKVPSETVNDFTYDVVLELTPTNNVSTTFNSFDIKFFSNSPSFIYTYAFIYNENDLLIKELCGKYEDEILSKKPDTRNPIKYVGYEKSTYFALKYFLNHFNDRFTVTKNASKSINELMKNIKNNEDKKIERAFKEKATKREKEKETERKRKEEHNKSIAKKVNANADRTGVSIILPKKPTSSTGKESGVNRVGKIKPKGKRK